jgi:hypothetical protein
MELPTIHALWIGQTLGKISSSCLQSFVMRGHKVLLHTYGTVSDVPEGVQCVDANKIIPAEKFLNIIKQVVMHYSLMCLDMSY